MIRWGVTVAVVSMVAGACASASPDNADDARTEGLDRIEAVPVEVAAFNIPSSESPDAPVVVDVDPGDHGVTSASIFPPDDDQVVTAVMATDAGDVVVAFDNRSVSLADPDGSSGQAVVDGDFVALTITAVDGSTSQERISLDDALEASSAVPDDTTGHRSAVRSVPDALAGRVDASAASASTVRQASATRDFRRAARIWVPVVWRPDSGVDLGNALASVEAGYCDAVRSSVSLPEAVEQFTCSATNLRGTGHIVLSYLVTGSNDRAIDAATQAAVDAVDRTCDEVLSRRSRQLGDSSFAFTLLGLLAAASAAPAAATYGAVLGILSAFTGAAAYETSPTDDARVACRAYAFDELLAAEVATIEVAGPTIIATFTAAGFEVVPPTARTVENLQPFGTRTSPIPTIEFELDTRAPDPAPPEPDPAPQPEPESEPDPMATTLVGTGTIASAGPNGSDLATTIAVNAAIEPGPGRTVTVSLDATASWTETFTCRTDEGQGELLDDTAQVDYRLDASTTATTAVDVDDSQAFSSSVPIDMTGSISGTLSQPFKSDCAHLNSNPIPGLGPYGSGGTLNLVFDGSALTASVTWTSPDGELGGSGSLATQLS